MSELYCVEFTDSINGSVNKSDEWLRDNKGIDYVLTYEFGTYTHVSKFNYNPEGTQNPTDGVLQFDMDHEYEFDLSPLHMWYQEQELLSWYSKMHLQIEPLTTVYVMVGEGFKSISFELKSSKKTYIQKYDHIVTLFEDENDALMYKLVI